MDVKGIKIHNIYLPKGHQQEIGVHMFNFHFLD